MIEGLHDLDRQFFLLLNSFHATWLNSFMELISGQVIWVPLILLFVIYSYKFLGRTKTAVFVLFLLLVIISSDVSSSYILKNIVNRLRPCRDLDLKPLIYSFGQRCGGKFGFVSSHAANATAIVFFSIRTLGVGKSWFHLFWIMPFLIGYSRIYLGVHYPGDIVGGTIIGLLWAWIFSKIFNSYQGANR